MTSITNPEEPSFSTGVLGAVLRQVEKHGLSTVLTIVLLGFVLWRLSGDLKANNEMLQQHMRVTQASAYVQYVTCVNLAILAGTPKETCSIPDGLR